MAGFRAAWREDEVRAKWVKVFDPSTASADREALTRELRKDVDGEGFRTSREGRSLIEAIQEQLQTIPDFRKVVPVAVMVGGYEFGADVYTALSELTHVRSGLVLLGYSAGYTKSYEGHAFSDGTSMNKRIFVPQEDLDTLLQNRDAPVLLIDHMLGMGSNTVAIRNKLRAIGMTGEIYLIHTSIWTGKVAVANVEDIDTVKFRASVIGHHFVRQYLGNREKLPPHIVAWGAAIAFNTSLITGADPTVHWSLFTAMNTSGAYSTYMNRHDIWADFKRLPKLKSNKAVPELVTELGAVARE